MQQYFTEKILTIDEEVELGKDILDHLTKVLRKDENYIFRIADGNGNIFLAHLKDKKALTVEKLDENNELTSSVTAIISLIKNDKFELTLQKLTELGVSRIVPFEAERSVVKANDKKIDRYQKILREAAEQSHRNFIPEITEFASIKDLKNYLSEVNLLAYEKEDAAERDYFTDPPKSISFLIGPEGGFSPKEVESIKKLGFRSVSLGKRILRAETASIYLASIIGRFAE